MPPEPWALQLRQRELGLKSLLFFNRTRKSTLLLQPRTVASVNRTRFLIFLQIPIENAQELVKEEGEESEAKTTKGRLLRSTDIVWWARFASGQPPQVETNSDAFASFSLSPPKPVTCAKRTGLGAVEAGL